jgi:hypothetical protein
MWSEYNLLVYMLFFDALMGIIVPVEFTLHEIRYRREIRERAMTGDVIVSQRPGLRWPLVVILCAGLVSTFAFVIYMQRPGASLTPPPVGPAYVKDIHFDQNTNTPLILIATVAASTGKLRIVLQNKQYFPTPNGDFWPVYQSIVLAVLDNAVEGQIIRIPVGSLASPPYPGEQLVFGKKPSDTKGNPYFVNPTLHLVRIFFLQGYSGEPQNYKFAFFATTDSSQFIMALPSYTLDKVAKWWHE